MHSFAEVGWLQPYPDELLDEIAFQRRRAGCCRRRTGDDRAGVSCGAAGPSAAPAGRADPARRAGDAGDRDSVAPGHERRCGQQRAATSPGHDAGAPAVAAERVGGVRAEPRRTGSARPVHGCPSALRRGGSCRHRLGGYPHHHASGSNVLRRRPEHGAFAAACLRARPGR